MQRIPIDRERDGHLISSVLFCTSGTTACTTLSLTTPQDRETVITVQLLSGESGWSPAAAYPRPHLAASAAFRHGSTPGSAPEPFLLRRAQARKTPEGLTKANRMERLVPAQATSKTKA